LPGFNADPSIIRVNDTYYIANSTFEWFPGVRLHESKDLFHWNSLPSALNTKTLLDMKGDPDSGGIWAPDLSYADGKFWLIYTDVKIVNGPFKDMHNYLTTTTDIKSGKWTDPIEVAGIGFDASLFHDEDGKKYLVQQTWDHREYHHPFDGITLTEFDTETMTLKPETRHTIYMGTKTGLVEGPHLYKIGDYYYLFAAQGGTVFTHEEVVARGKSLDEMFTTEPGEIFLTNFDTPDNYIQKQGHGALVSTPGGEWYYASLSARPWHHATESAHDPRGWSTLGRETSIQKVEWDGEGWPRVVGGHGGSRFVQAPKDAIETSVPIDHSQHDDFDSAELDTVNFNTLRIPFSEEIGSLTANPGHLRLYGRETLGSLHTQAHIARRWQAFNFDAETKVKFNPSSYQQAAGLTNYYNTTHWSMIQLTLNEKTGHRVIEVLEVKGNQLTSYLKDNAIEVPDDLEYVWFKTKVRKRSYTYAYSFDGSNWIDIDVELDAAVLSDDYIVRNYGGFFTGAFVGLAAYDYSWFKEPADFDYFDYKEFKDEEDDGTETFYH
jgi:xylan 1,4-beta-xylosidase